MSQQPEPEAVSEIRSGLAGGRYSSCGGYGCYDHTWHMEDVLRAYDAIVAERDAAVRERDAIKANYDESVRECANVMAMRENVSSQLWDCMNERDGYRARLAACETVVEQLRGLRAPSLCCDGENNDDVDHFRDGYTSALDDMRDILRAAVVAKTQGG